MSSLVRLSYFESNIERLAQIRATSEKIPETVSEKTPNPVSIFDSSQQYLIFSWISNFFRNVLPLIACNSNLNSDRFVKFIYDSLSLIER